MKARHHTQQMLFWWHKQGITCVDLAIRRHNNSMIWHYSLPIWEIPLPWASAENAHGSEIYIRPARSSSWPLVFLDDVDPSMAIRINRAYRSLIILTSHLGGCHIWLACKSPLDEHSRHLAQCWLVPRVHADPGSSSGDHLGRLAGFKNWKRGGQWVNVLCDSQNGPPWAPPHQAMAPRQCTLRNQTKNATSSPVSPNVDLSASGREWGWVCGALEAGIHPDRVFQKLLQRAQARKGTHAKSYVTRTMRKALK